jgi:hypothetical protein
MFTRRESSGMVDALDDALEASGGNMAEGWIYGALLAVPIAALGVYNIVARHGWWLRVQPRNGIADHENPFTVVEGTAAVWLGAAILSTALTIHFRWFWGNHRRLSRYHQPLEFFGITAMGIAFAVFGVLHFRHVVLG